MNDKRAPIEAEAELIAEEPFDASDPIAVNRARKKAGRKKKNNLEFVEAMMSVPQGRKWLYNFMESCAVFGNPLVHGVDGHVDPLATHFRLGEQNAGKRVLSDLQNFPDYYAAMMRESKNSS